jgi:predicted metal-dependent TIM-barrel fold hydrolase
MADEPAALFDAHLHPEGLTDQDLETLRVFGVSAALVAAHHAPIDSTSRDILAHFDSILSVQLPRLERQSIRAYAAIGVDPRCVPRRGMSEILSALPGYFATGKVVALGEVGLHSGSEAEESALVDQLQLSAKLKLPVLVHTPSRDKERHTRRILNLLKAAGILPRRALVDHASGRTVRTILECGYFAGLTIHPDELSAERASALVARLGSERLVLNSDLGDGPGDIIGLPRVVHLMQKRKLSERVIHKVAFANAARFFGVSLRQER